MASALDSDRRLVDRARVGSRRAKGVLFRRHWSGVWKTAVAIAGSPHSADDIAQDAFIKGFERLDQLTEAPRFGPWVKQIAARLALDHLRGAREVATAEEELLTVAWLDPEAPRSDVRAAVAALEPERRTIVVLRYWLEYTPTEIAETLDLALGTVNSRLGRARDELRERLEEGADVR